MNIDHYKFLAGAAEAVVSRTTEEMKTKGQTLIWLADKIVEQANVEQDELEDEH